jgi:hypothetical protein
MYLFIHVCIYLFNLIYIYDYLYFYLYYSYVYIHVYMYIYTYLFRYELIHNRYTSIRVYIYILHIDIYSLIYLFIVYRIMCVCVSKVHHLHGVSGPVGLKIGGSGCVAGVPSGNQWQGIIPPTEDFLIFYSKPRFMRHFPAKPGLLMGVIFRL